MPTDNEVKEVVEQIEYNRGINLGTVAVLGAAGFTGAVLWNKVLKPLGRKVREKIATLKHQHDKKKGPVVLEAEKASVE